MNHLFKKALFLVLAVCLVLGMSVPVSAQGNPITAFAALEQKPQAVTGLVYNGTEQTGVASGEHYELSGTARVTDAGEYTATATLKESYTWSDGSTDPIEITWSIVKAELKATYKGEEISCNGIPELAVEVTGFVNGEAAETAPGYKAPTVTAPAAIEEGKSYELTPAGGEAANYTFTYVPGNLTVDPVELEPGTYPMAFAAGTGATYEQGTYTVTANLFIPGELNTQLPGVTAYMTNPNNPLGLGGHTGIPNTPVADNATLVIGEEGSKTLTLDVVNPVFTLQQLRDGATVHVQNTTRDDQVYSGGSVTHNGRIIQIVVTLDDDSGAYTFTDCVEFPTILGADWTVPLSLTVDFSEVPLKTQIDEVNKPQAATGLIYTGTEQTGVAAGEGYELSGTVSAKEAEEYTATATLQAGYTWSDGSTAPVEITWFIAKAELTATYKEETIAGNGTPALAVEVTGFINGETAETATGYVAPTVTAPATIEADRTYELTPAGGAAANYQFKYVAGNLVINTALDPGKLEAGTYRTTANLYLPGELNAQLPGVTAYMTNPNNPLGLGGHTGIPDTPVADNATLVVGENDSQTIILDVVNPVFTLQQIKDGTNVHIVGMVRDNVTYSGNTGVSRNGRITRLYITLDDTSGTYTFSDCLEFPTLLETDWHVPLKLGVDFASALKTSDSTEVNLPEDPGDPEPGGHEVVLTPDTPGEVNIEGPSGATVNAAALLGASADGKVSATLPALNIMANTSVSADPIKINIPAGTVVSAPQVWGGIINMPTVLSNNSVTVTPDSGKKATVNTVIEIGYGDVPLTFDRAVRLLIPGQAGKEAGYSRGGVFTKITNTLSADSQTAGDALAPGGDGKIDVGNDDLAIWTKHFTSFVTYSQTKQDENPAGDDVTELKPGTYTVTANIFLKKEDTKLPLNPHLTSGVFPPKDPVSNNATLIIAEDGTAKVIVPTPITVMSLNSISGLDIIDMKKNASGEIKSLTINLGRLDSSEEIIRKKCKVSVTLSELAQSISGFGPDQNWPATFELYLAGEPPIDPESSAIADRLINAALDPDDPGKLEAGTYRITANLYLPGELNAQLPGVTAYMTNPNNPLGLGGHTGIPDTPVADNATLVVGGNDSQTIILDVVNPVFTLQQIKDGTNVHIVGMVRDNVTYSGNTGVSRNGRITRLYITLDDTSGTYTFSDCLEFPTLLETDWHVPLKLGVDFASALKTSDSIEVNLPEDPGDPVPTDLTELSILIPTGPEPSVPAEISDDSSKTKIVYVTRLKPGTYTVTANIFLKKEDTKLPMNPHLTSGVFPPKDPVSNNATLIVAEDGTAKVIIPITITVMSLNSISGLNIINMEKDASGAIKSLTINLGRLDNPGNIITKRCNVSVTLSELAQSISGFGPDHNWPATFELALVGVPTVQVETTADANNPQTGDDTPLAAYTALLLVSLGCMGCLAFRRKRRGA